MSLRRTAAQWMAAGRRAVVVEVVATQGSTPREAGARMLVAADAAAGTIGGGHLEWQALEVARAMLAQGEPGPRLERYPLGPALGQCCGGAVVLRFLALDASGLGAWPDEPALFALDLYGAGHVGRAIVRLLQTLPCRVRWVDERPEAFEAFELTGRGAWAPEQAARIEVVCVDAVEAEVAQAPAGAHFLVLTHRHDLDLRLCEAILRRDDFAFLGLIGSQTKRARFEHRLRARGIPEDAIARMVCPIGVPGIEGKAPAVIAVAVVAQLLQHARPPPA